MSLAIEVPLAWLGSGSLMHDAAIVCDGGRVAYAGPRSSRPDADEVMQPDGFLMPGVADRHVHVGLSDPAAVLLGGVTAIRDLGWIPEEIFPLANASELPSFTGPLIRAAGPMLTAIGGYPANAAWAPAGLGRELDGPEDATATVDELADRGAAAIKVALNTDHGPAPSDAVLAAIVESAHRRELPVTAHTQGRGQAERAVRTGVDEFAHTPWSERLSDDLVAAAARTCRIVSTLDIHSFGEVTPDLKTACDNLARFRAAGGTVVYGTDLGNGSIPPGIHVREALLLSEIVRMSPEEVLVAMTAGPISPGGPADVVVLGADPLIRLEALGDVRVVVRSGRVVSG